MKLANLARTTVLAALAAAGLSTAASAAVYTSQAAFAAANPGLNLVSYSGLAPNGADFVGSPYTVGGVTATGPRLMTVDTSVWGSVDSLLDDTFNGYITLSFAPSTAVGFYVAGSYGGGQPVDITVYDSGSNVLFSGSPTVGGVFLPATFSFWGIDGVGAISSINISAAPYVDGFVSVAEIEFGNPVPEPATWALLIAGFGMVGTALRRRTAALAA